MVEEAEEVTIVGHIGPDDDSVASMLATYWLIKERFLEKKTRMICSSNGTSEWEYFENFDKIEFVEEVVDGLVSKTELAKEKPLLIMLDGGTFNRFSKKPEELKGLFKKTICIDHHKNKPDKFDLVYISPLFSSAAEAVYRLLVDPNRKIPKRLAEIFLLGILGDTGDFAYLNKETAGVLEVVEKLIEEGDVGIQSLVAKYRRIPKRVLKLVGEMVSETRYYEGISNWPPFQVTMVERNFIEDNNFSDEEISRASHLYMSKYLRFVEGYGWGFTITPRENKICNLSFRSLPDLVNVRKLAEKFDGGGHDLASGGEIKTKDPKRALEVILKWMGNNKVS